MREGGGVGCRSGGVGCRSGGVGSLAAGKGEDRGCGCGCFCCGPLEDCCWWTGGVSERTVFLTLTLPANHHGSGPVYRWRNGSRHRQTHHAPGQCQESAGNTGKPRDVKRRAFHGRIDERKPLRRSNSALL